MASISSGGVNLDVDSLITKLMTAEKVPLTKLQSKASAIESRISAFGSLKSQLSALSDAAARLTQAGTWNSKAATSSNAAAIGASISNPATAAATAFSVEVSQLARAQSASSAAVSGGDGMGAGVLSIQLGGWSVPAGGGAPAFAAGAGAAIDIQVSEGESLASVAGKINAAGAGVTATVIKDLSGERLLMRSASTGESAGFRVRATPAGGGGGGADLALLGLDDAALGQGMAANAVQYARNANASINGVSVSSATNTLADTVAGLSLTLSQTTSAPVEITIATDNAALKSGINGFVSAYNAMNQMLNSATKYDAATKQAALLQGDSVTVGLQNALRTLAASVTSGSGPQRLSDIGITLAKDGSGNLSVDAVKLDAALRNPKAVADFFMAPASAGDPSSAGFAVRFSAFTQAAVGSEGSIASRTGSLQLQKTGNGREQDRLSDRLTLTESRLRKQYSALDANLSKLTALDTFVSQQIAQWNRSKD